jgi:hypothetical protein
MKFLILIFWGFLWVPLLNAGGLIAPRSLFGPLDDDLLVVSAIKREMGLDYPPSGAFGVVISHGENDWMALYSLPSQAADSDSLTLLCRGGLYGTPTGELLRCQTDLSRDHATGVHALLLKEVSAAENTIPKISRTDVGRVEYWVSLGGGNILSGLSISNDNDPEVLQRLSYILVHLANSHDLEQGKWRQELTIHLRKNKKKWRPSQRK